MIAWDACDPALAQQFAAQGFMPNMARLLKTAARAPVRNPHGLFVGALWVSFSTALHTARHGFHCWDKIELESYEHRLSPPNVAHLPQFWRMLGDSGLRVAAIDVPHMKADHPVNGIQVMEWGCHDKHFGFHTWPPELAKEIESEFGFHPALKGAEAYEVRDCAPDDDIHRDNKFRTREEDCALLNDLMAGARKKKELVLSLLNREPWDFFVAVFGESHAIGHQQWHLHDPSHPRHDRDTVEAMGGDPIAQVYAELDRALGEIEAAAKADLFILHLSHGMGPHYDGTHLLEEVLVRLENHYAATSTSASPAFASALKRWIRPAAPTLRALAHAVGVPHGLRKRVGAALETWPADRRSQQRYFLEPNNTVYGGIRLNLIGREPRGRVQPEAADALIAELERDLLELVNADTGKSVVRAVQRCADWHERTPSDVMPDLFVDWDRTAPIERVHSDKVGLIEIPYDHWRTGDHRPAGLLLAQASGLPSGERLPGLAIEDVGCSIAARLGVAMTEVDGVECGWLSGRENVNSVAQTSS